MSFIVMATWKFIQSEYFGEVLASRVNQTISKKTNFDISFSHLEIDMFPPATYLKNVKLKNKDIENYVLDISAGSLSLSFGLSDFFSSKLSVDQIGLEDANVVIKGMLDISKSEKSEFLYSDIFPLIKETLTNSLPVKIGGVHLKRSYVESEFASGYFEVLDATLYRKVLETKVRAHNLKLSKKVMRNGDYNSFDFISIGFHLDEKKLLLKQSEVWKDTQKVVLDGALKFKKKNKVSFNGSIYLRGIVENINYLKNNKDLKNIGLAGVYEAKTDVNTNLDSSLSMKGFLRIVDLRSEYANLDNVYTEFEFEKSIISLMNTEITHNTGTLKLLKKVNVFDVNLNKLLNEKLNVKVENFSTNAMLYALREDLDILKGRLNGEVSVDWDGQNVNFNIKENSTLTNFSLKSTGSTPILKNKKVKIDRGVVIILEESGVELDFDLRVGKKTKLFAKGLIGESGVDIEVRDSIIDFEEVGAISGVQAKGYGPFSMNIIGSGRDVNFDFNVNLKEASILGYYLDNFKSKLSLNLDDLLLTIKKGAGFSRNTKYRANGFLDFLNEKINLSINVVYSNLEDSLKLLDPISKNIDFLHSKYLDFTFKSKIKLTGDLKPDGLRVYGVVDGSDLQIFKEKSESLSFNFNFVDNLLSINKIRLRHGSSDLVGNYNINVKSNYFEYDAKLISGQIEDLESYRFLGLGFSSDVTGEFYGNGTTDDFSTRSHLKFVNSFLGNVQVPESLITVYNNSKEIFSSGSFLGDRLTFNMYLNLNKNMPQKSYLNSFVNFKNIKELVSVISNHNMETKNISGKVKGNITTSFSFFDMSKFTLNGILTEFEFIKGDKRLFIDGPNAIFKMIDGEIEKVNFKLKSNEDDYLTILGSGSLKKDLDISQKFKIDASFVELLSSKVAKSSGEITGQGRIYGDINDLDYDHSINGEDIFLKLTTVPSSFSDLHFKLFLDERTIYLNEVNGKFGNGEVFGNGVVKLVLPYPEIDIGMEFKNSYIPLFKKSGVLLSGKAKLEGKTFPYLLNGSVTVLNGSINDELQDLSPPSMSGSQGHEKYVPENKYSNKFDYFDLDLLVDFDKPVIVRNLLTDLRLLGNGRVRGKLYKPELNGSVEVVPGLSKLLFKGNEFIIKDGSLSFSEQKGLVPELNFHASSRINQYSINLDVYGMANDPQLSVSSDPFLSQEDIFSLLTLGFTSEISDELEEKDLRSATTLGIGTLLFDQLLKNQGLSSNLGLKLSVLPEFEEDESSLLKGKSGVSDSGSSRYKTATKIKLEKKVSRNVDLSLASTVGGSAEQKQEMNVNYNVLKNVSLEGVYEINSGGEDQYQEPTSFGVDVKIQWSY